MNSEFKKEIILASTLAVDLAVAIDVSICNLQSLVTADSDHSRRLRAKNTSQSTQFPSRRMHSLTVNTSRSIVTFATIRHTHTTSYWTKFEQKRNQPLEIYLHI